MDKLDCDNRSVIPADLQFRVNFLNPKINQYFESALHLLHSTSFPLKTLRTTVKGPETFDLPAVKAAGTLILVLEREDPPIPLETLKNLTNSTIILEYLEFPVSKFEIIDWVKYLISTNSDLISSVFIISSVSEVYIKNLLFQLGIVFNEFESDLERVNERFIPNALRFSIPTEDGKSQIQAYGIEETENRHYQWKVVIQVIS